MRGARGLVVVASAAASLAVGCADFRAATKSELEAHPPQPARRFAADAPPVTPSPGDWALYLAQGPAVFDHQMAGWELVEVVSDAATNGYGLEILFTAQTPTDQIHAHGWVDLARRDELGTYFVSTTGEGITELRFPRAKNHGRGFHHHVPQNVTCLICGPSTKSALTPGLSERSLDSTAEDDEDLLLREAALDLRARLLADPTAPRENLAVSAGSFDGAVRASVSAQYFQLPAVLHALANEENHYRHGPVKIWIHPAVPALGLVKAEFPGGATLELLDFGHHEGETK